MPLETIVKKNITYASSTTTVKEISEIMDEDDVGAVLVIETGIPQGIVTDRDIVLRCVSKGLDPQSTPVEKIMTRGVEAVNLEEGIYNVAKKMKDAHVRRIAIVDSAGNAAGLLSFDDVFELLSSELVRKGKHGARSTKQAIAIGLSKARRAGIKVPKKKAA